MHTQSQVPFLIHSSPSVVKLSCIDTKLSVPRCAIHATNEGGNGTIQDVMYVIACIMFDEFPAGVMTFVDKAFAHYQQHMDLPGMVKDAGLTGEVVNILRGMRSSLVLDLLMSQQVPLGSLEKFCRNPTMLSKLVKLDVLLHEKANFTMAWSMFITEASALTTAGEIADCLESLTAAQQTAGEGDSKASSSSTSSKKAKGTDAAASKPGGGEAEESKTKGTKETIKFPMVSMKSLDNYNILSAYSFGADEDDSVDDPKNVIVRLTDRPGGKALTTMPVLPTQMDLVIERMHVQVALLQNAQKLELNYSSSYIMNK